MNPVIYQKTDRKPKTALDANLLSVLCLVDGVRDKDELQRTIKIMRLPLDGVAQLLRAGLIASAPATKLKRRQRLQKATMPEYINRLEAEVNTNHERMQRRWKHLARYVKESAKNQLGLRYFMLHRKIAQAVHSKDYEALIPEITLAISKQSGAAIGVQFLRDSMRLLESYRKVESVVRPIALTE